MKDFRTHLRWWKTSTLTWDGEKRPYSLEAAKIFVLTWGGESRGTQASAAAGNGSRCGRWWWRGWQRSSTAIACRGANPGPPGHPGRAGGWPPCAPGGGRRSTPLPRGPSTRGAACARACTTRGDGTVCNGTMQSHAGCCHIGRQSQVEGGGSGGSGEGGGGQSERERERGGGNERLTVILLKIKILGRNLGLQSELIKKQKM